MQTTSDTYKTLRTAVGSHYDVRVVCNDITYTLEDFKDPIKLTRALFADDGPQIGQSPSAYISLSLYADIDNWPRMASFSVDFRLLSEDEETASEWITLGSYYTDTRTQSSGGVLTITGYDPMLKFAVSWTDKVPESAMPTTWPITSAAAVNLLTYAVDFTLDPRTALDDTTAYVGLDTTSTARDILNTVAAANAGNWCITPGGKLYLVPLSMSSESGEVADHLGMMSFDYGEILPEIVSVTLTSFDGTEATAHSESGSDGTAIKADCDFSDSAAATLAFSKCSGYQYGPFEAGTVWVDPAVELGDFISYGDAYYRIFDSTWSIGRYITADLSAPVETAVEHEYVVTNDAAKTLAMSEKQTETAAAALTSDISTLRTETSSLIQQSASDIRTEVSQEYYTIDETDAAIATAGTTINQRVDGLEVTITSVNTTTSAAISEVKSYVRYVDGTVIVGTSAHEQDFRVSPTQLSACYNGQPISYWNQNEHVTPKKLRIPSGGSLQTGTVLWQPRTSGNLSIMWVGEDD